MKTYTPPPTQKMFYKQVRLKGITAEIGIESDDEIWAQNILETAATEMTRITSLFASTNTDNPLKKINAMAGIQPVTVTKEVYELISRYVQVHALADGIFTTTHCLGNNKASEVEDKEIDKCATGKKNALHLYRCVEFNKENCTIFLTQRQLRLQLNGIARGYATERVKHILKQNGILGGLIHWGADMIGWGNLSNGKNAA